MQPEANQFALTDLLACVGREVGMRKSCYPKWDKVTSLDALSPNRKRELSMMEALYAYLQEQVAQPAPLADAALAELEELEQQATPTPWTHWVGSGKIFYGEADTNKPGNYSPANLQLFNAEDYDREDLDTEVEGFNIQPSLAEDDAAFVARLRNDFPGLLARLRALQAFKNYVHGRFDDAGIKKHEEQNAINGCRVGSRFDDLLACVRSQNELLDSMGQTNTVLATRLKLIADRLPAIAQELGDAEDLADDGNGDGYEACYNAAGNARGAIKGLLRDINGGKEQSNA